MIYLVEKLPLSLGTEGKFIFKQYKSLKSLERYALSWIMKKYPEVQVSIYHQNIYGTPIKVIGYSMKNGYIQSGQIYPVKSI